eukprot:995379-Pleurochrysis_carterae.AAC.1
MLCMPATSRQPRSSAQNLLQRCFREPVADSVVPKCRTSLPHQLCLLPRKQPIQPCFRNSRRRSSSRCRCGRGRCRFGRGRRLWR